MLISKRNESLNDFQYPISTWANPFKTHLFIPREPNWFQDVIGLMDALSRLQIDIIGSIKVWGFIRFQCGSCFNGRIKISYLTEFSEVCGPCIGLLKQAIFCNHDNPDRSVSDFGRELAFNYLCYYMNSWWSNVIANQ